MLGVKSQRCESQISRGREMHQSRKAQGLEEIVVLLCQIKSVPNPFGQDCMPLFFIVKAKRLDRGSRKDLETIKLSGRTNCDAWTDFSCCFM